MANGRNRREPAFDMKTDAGALDVRLSRADRAGGRMGQAGRRGAAQRDEGSSGGRSVLGRLVYFGLVLGLWGLIGAAGLVAFHASQLPPIDQLAVPKRPPNIAILASDGTLLANRGETGGRAVALKELPPYLPKAFIAIEDRRFYDHFGIDPVGIGRAVMRNLNRGGVTQGGSTLTQQLAKNLFLTQERTASRKIQEAILALWLERTYSKDQILELYLNRVYFGAGAYGVEAAAQRYYGKSAREVSLSEAAVLAGLVQAPSRLAPNRNPDAAQARAQLVLTAMGEQGFVRPNQMMAALTAPAKAAVPTAPARPITRPISSWTCSTISSARSTATSSSRPRSIPCSRLRPSAPSSTSSTPGGNASPWSRAPWSPCGRTAPSRRWSAGAITGRASSTAPPPPAASRARPSSPSSISRPSSAA